MDLTRRTFLGNLALGAVSIPLVGTARLLAAPDPWGGFRMGMQSYSVRKRKTPAEALAAYKDLGLAFAEFYPGNLPVSADAETLKGYQASFKSAGVTLAAYGVMGFKKDGEADARKIFDFAKAMGAGMISADPDPEAGEYVDKLIGEYGIKIGIHNHGPTHRFNGVDTVLKAVEGRSTGFGACVDTGHTLRSAENPVEWIRKLGERVHGCHLKDVKGSKDQAKFTKLGEGDLDVVGTLKALKDVGFTGCLSLEYEENPDDPMADIKECLETVKKAVKKL